MYYYKKNIGDYRGATSHLTLLEHGVYGWLLDTYYMDEKPLPVDERQLFRIALARTDEEKQAVRDVIGEFFEQTEQGWVHQRCESEIKAFHVKANSNRNNGNKGGRPSKRNPQQNPNKTQSAVFGNPQETLTNNQEPLTNNQEPLNNIASKKSESKTPSKRVTKKQLAIDSLVNLGVDEKHAVAVIEARKGKAFSEVAIEEVVAQANTVNLSFAQAIEFAAKNDWGSFKADWYQNRVGQQKPQHQSTTQSLAQQRAAMDKQRSQIIDVGDPKKPYLIEGVGHA